MRGAAPLLLALSLAGCATATGRRLEPGDAARIVPGIEVGRTTAEELILRFSTPHAAFEDERVLAWRLVPRGRGPALPAFPGRPEPGGPVLPNWKQARISLVVVLDGAGVVERVSVVEVR